ncbi:MAG: hypothetical protein JKX91_01255 [Rhizobiaceae bacterium]|nr:hypothetical protein [Rhizobiaceae bacterium]
MKKIVLALSLSLALGVLSAPAAGAEIVSVVMGNTLENIILPAYANFQRATNELKGQVTTLCQTPDNSNLESARRAFSKTAIAWGGIEFLRSGPVMKNDRLERILFYPDRKSTGLKQVQRALVMQDQTVTKIETLKKKSVAVQGLGAMEFLLFGTGFEKLRSDKNTFRCQFAEAASGNLHVIASELIDAWNAKDGIKSQWLNPDSADSIFRNQREAVNQILGTAVHGLEAVRDIRLGAFLRNGKSDRPKSALFWRSNNTIPVITANVEMVAKLFDEGGMGKLVANDENGVMDAMRFEFKQAFSTLAAIDKPIKFALRDKTQRKKLEYLKIVLGFLIERIDKEYSAVAGLSSGFSFSDGD